MKNHDRSLRIVLTVHHFPPDYSAGAEIYTFRLANWLVEHGHRVDVVSVESITCDKGQGLHCQQDLYEGISVWRLHFNLSQSPAPFRYSFDNPAIGEWFSQFLQKTRPDIVHINSCYLLSVSTIAAVKELGLPLIVTLHDFWFVCPRITLLKPTGQVCTVPENVVECAWCLATESRRFRWPEVASHGAASLIVQSVLGLSFGAKLLGIQPDATELSYRRELLLDALNQADLILAPSEFLRNIFIQQGVDPARILYSRLGLDTRHWVPQGEPKTKPETKPKSAQELRISYIGQLSHHKGVHILLKAFIQLVCSRRQARLKVYGPHEAFPDYVKSLQKIAHGNPLIEFMGRFDNRRIAEILDQTDVIVVPSIWYENSPITIMEALTTGTPVIASDLGGMPEMVHHNVNGLLFKVGDVDDLATQLQWLVDEPGLVKSLAANARPVRMIDDEMVHIVSLYENVLSR